MALDELIRRANSGDVAAMEELGREYARKGNYGQSIEWNQKAASKGSGAAMMALSSIYRNGSGVAANMSEANKWLKMSADAGHGAAMFSIVEDYRDGSDGFPQNPALAFQYLQKMCYIDGWSNYGRFETAECYLKGIGTSQNVSSAINMFSQLANEGYGDAQFKLAYIYGSGNFGEIDHNQTVYWANQALNSTKTAGLAKIDKVHQLATQILQMENGNQSNNGGGSSSGGCYVATAVYGSYDCPEVWVLRRFRDLCLTETWYGRAFIRVYYAISPTLVKWFGKTRWFNNMWKPKLDSMVTTLKKRGYEDTPYND